MKKIFTILTAVLITATVWAQSPEKMTYQSVIRNASDQLVTSQDVGMQISILQGSASGTAVYVETHTTATNTNGLVTIEIGIGTTSDDFSAIDWSNGLYFIKTETDPTTAGGTNYTITGTSQLLSVPYALYSKTAGTADYNNLTNLPTLFNGDWSSLTGTTPNVSTFTNDAGYLTSYTEADPIFTTWDKTTGISITESQISDFGTYLTSFTELDPIYSANFDLSSATNGDLLKFNGTKFVKFTPNYLTSYTETDPIFTTNFDFTNLATDDLLKYNGTKFVKFTPNYLTSFTEVDGSITNEIQDLTLTSNTLKITNNTSATNIDLSTYLDNTDNQNLDNVLTQGTSAGNKNITNLADPVNVQDATTKAYVDLLENRIWVLENPDKVKDYDGNVYETVTIGSQVWMAENLKTTHYDDGTAIPLVTDNATWRALGDNNTDDAYCYYNNDASGEAAIYGTLYTYAAAMKKTGSSSANPSGVQGVCPTGWHLPSDAEWTELTTNLGGLSVAGGKMKETGTTHWTSPNTGATNSSGFSALPGGHRSGLEGPCYFVGVRGYWWSSTEGSSTDAYGRYLSYNGAEAFRNNYYKSNGFSVRCTRD